MYIQLLNDFVKFAACSSFVAVGGASVTLPRWRLLAHVPRFRLSDDLAGIKEGWLDRPLVA
jgi:hypothetical protein